MTCLGVLLQQAFNLTEQFHQAFYTGAAAIQVTFLELVTEAVGFVVQLDKGDLDVIQPCFFKQGLFVSLFQPVHEVTFLVIHQGPVMNLIR